MLFSFCYILVYFYVYHCKVRRNLDRVENFSLGYGGDFCLHLLIIAILLLLTHKGVEVASAELSFDVHFCHCFDRLGCIGCIASSIIHVLVLKHF